MTFLLLHAINAVLAIASLLIWFRNPSLWDDQALIYSTLAGALMTSLTAILLGISLLFSGESRWKTNGLHLVLTLTFAGIQGYLIYRTGKDIGILQLLKSQLG